MANRFESKFMDCSVPLDGGSVLKFSFKAVLYEDGDAYWELIHLILASKPRLPARFKICQYINSYKDEWFAILEELGCDRRTFKPSQRAAREWGEAYLTDPKVRQ
jgi:hypothetical protein